MNKLKCYLVGSIQAAKDSGVKWREDLTSKLEELQFVVQDPTTAECNNSLADNIEDQKTKLYNLKRGGAWELWDQVMGDIQQADITCVNNSKFIIVSYDPKIPIGGTIEEIVEAHHKNIPIYTVSYAPIVEFNDWVLARLRQNFNCGGKIFPNYKQLMDFIGEEYKNYAKEYKEFLKKEEEKVKKEEEKAKKEEEKTKKEPVKDTKKETAVNDKTEHK